MERFFFPILLSLLFALGIDTYLVFYFPPDIQYFIAFVLVFGYIINVVVALILYLFKTRNVELVDLKRKQFRWSFRVGVLFGLLSILLLMIQSSLNII